MQVDLQSALLGLPVSAKSTPGADSEPEAFGRCAVGGLVAVDQPEARLAFVCLDVEADSSAVGQLWVATSTHQLASMGIRPAFHEQLGDATLQRVDLRLLGISNSGRGRRQLGDITLDSLGKLDLDLGSGFSAHDLPDLNAELG